MGLSMNPNQGYTCRMSVQISVRLPDQLVEELDALVEAGSERSRASFIERSLQRELRRWKTLRDIEILRQTGTTPYPDLDGLAEQAASTSLDLG